MTIPTTSPAPAPQPDRGPVCVFDAGCRHDDRCRHRGACGALAEDISPDPASASQAPSDITARTDAPAGERVELPEGMDPAFWAAAKAWDAERRRLNELWHGGRCAPCSVAHLVNTVPMLLSAINAYNAALAPDPSAAGVVGKPDPWVDTRLVRFDDTVLFGEGYGGFDEWESARWEMHVPGAGSYAVWANGDTGKRKRWSFYGGPDGVMVFERYDTEAAARADAEAYALSIVHARQLAVAPVIAQAPDDFPGIAGRRAAFADAVKALDGLGAAALAPDPSAAGVAGGLARIEAVASAHAFVDACRMAEAGGVAAPVDASTLWSSMPPTQRRPYLRPAVASLKALDALAAAPTPRAAPEGSDLVSYLRRQWAWSKETFGPALRTKGIVQHITKELREIEADPHDLAEWIDVIILAMDGFWRHGGKPEDLLSTMQAKQDRNFARTWPDWRTMGEDQAIEHDRSGEAKAATPAQGAGVDLAGVIDALVESSLRLGKWRELGIAKGIEAAESAQRGTRSDLDAAIAALQRDVAISRRTAGPESGDGVTGELRDELDRLSHEATDGPWFVTTEDVDGNYGGGPDCGSGWKGYAISTSAGQRPGKHATVLDSINSGVGEIHEDFDENGVHAWDEAARANTAYIVALVNWHRARISAEDRTSLADGATGGEAK